MQETVISAAFRTHLIFFHLPDDGDNDIRHTHILFALKGLFKIYKNIFYNTYERTRGV